jgi:hypothetical protein
MTPRGFGIKEGKNNNKRKSKMKRLNITFGTILLVLGCFAFSPVVKAEPPIVGLWQVEYTGACDAGSASGFFYLPAIPH